jgi:uncharacterized protein (TIGR02646 family)
MPLDENDQLIIQAALARGGSVWNDVTLDPVKQKIKQFFRDNGGEQCCYCRREMRDEFNMVIDIEHVLPKSLFREFMFELLNLNISCKRCNMRIKKERVDFLVDQATIAAKANQSDQYLMVHPNLDNYYANIDYIVNIHNTLKTVKYLHKTAKGAFTYLFFELEKIEIDTLNTAQGINTAGSQLSVVIPDNLATEAYALLDHL